LLQSSYKGFFAFFWLTSVVAINPGAIYPEFALFKVFAERKYGFVAMGHSLDVSIKGTPSTYIFLNSSATQHTPYKPPTSLSVVQNISPSGCTLEPKKFSTALNA
jgi:hypothetical protein